MRKKNISAESMKGLRDLSKALWEWHELEEPTSTGVTGGIRSTDCSGRTYHTRHCPQCRFLLSNTALQKRWTRQALQPLDCLRNPTTNHRYCSEDHRTQRINMLMTKKDNALRDRKRADRRLACQATSTLFEAALEAQDLPKLASILSGMYTEYLNCSAATASTSDKKASSAVKTTSTSKVNPAIVLGQFARVATMSAQGRRYCDTTKVFFEAISLMGGPKLAEVVAWNIDGAAKSTIYRSL